MRHQLSVFCIFCIIPLAALRADQSRATNPSIGDLIKQLKDNDPDKVCAAALALGRRGPSKDAVGALAGLLKSADGRVKWTAAEALYRLKHPAGELVPVYAELLTATKPEVRAASAWRLGRWGSAARPAVTVLAASLRDEDLEVRVQVGQALANLGEEAEPALPALMRALGDQQLDEVPADESVRLSPALPALVVLAEKAIPLLIESASKGVRRATRAFPAFGPRAVPPLVRALEAKDASTRRFAVVALREMARSGGLPQNAADKVEGRLTDPDEGVRLGAAMAMAWVRPENGRIAPILEKSGEQHGITESDLFTHLERLAPHNDGARKLLFRKLDDADKEKMQEAYRRLAELELPADQVLKVWLGALSHGDPGMRQRAVGAIQRLGPAAKLAKPALRERLTKESDNYAKGGILDALVAIDPDDAKLVGLLIESLGDSEGRVRYRALDCIARVGTKAKEALPKLEAALTDPQAKGDRSAFDSSELRDLVSAIVKVAPESDRTVAALLKALRNPTIRAVHCPKNSWRMREHLEDELYALLPKSAPLLREALKDKDAQVRRSSALTLLRAGLDTKTALPVLTEKLWGGKETDEEKGIFQSRVVELLSRRPMPDAEAIAASWCEAWRLASREERETIEKGLFVLQPESLPHLLAQLRQAKNAQSRWDLAYLLARFDGQSKVVVPILRKELSEANTARHYSAAVAIGQLGPDAGEAVSELAKLLDSPHPAVRVAAAQTLAKVGAAAMPAVPRLKAMLKDASQEMRIVAASSLGRIDPDVSEALALLRDALLSEKDRDAVRYIGAIERPEGAEGDPVFPDGIEEGILRFGERAVGMLADILDDTNLDEWAAIGVSSQCGAYARVRAALLLAEIGPDAHKAVPTLTRALEDKDLFIRDAAASALGRIGLKAVEAAPACIALFKEQNRFAAGGTWESRTQFNAGRRRGSFDFRSLGRHERLTREQTAAFLYGSYKAPDAYLRSAYLSDAAHVLSRIDAKACSALPVLEEAAKDPDHPARLSAALAIWRCGRESPELIRAFTAALKAHAESAKETSESLPREVRECLAELGAELKPAMGALVALLKQRPSYSDEDIATVVEALGKFGADAKPHVDLLDPLLRGSSRWIPRSRVAAALALHRITQDTDTAFPILREVLLGQEEHASIYSRPNMANTARVHATRALGELAGKGEKQAKSLLTEMAKGDENSHVRLAAREAMTRVK